MLPTHILQWKNDTYPFPGLFWSQHYQANLVPVDAAYLAGNDRVTGLTLWQFADIKANDGDTKQCGACQWQQPIPANLTSPWTCAYFPIDPTKCGRPGGFNHKVSWLRLCRRPSFSKDFSNILI